MDCPICLRSIDNHDVDLLARHLRERHDFESLDAGRIAKSVQEWESYDASRARYLKGSPDPAAGDDSGRGGQPDRDRGGMGGGDLLPVAVESRPVVAGSRTSLEP
jgi:hypothetical protein